MAKPLKVDVLSLVESGLRESERLRSGGSGDPYVDALASAVDYASRNRERQEKKLAERSEDSMKIMALQAGNYNTNYNNASLDVNIKRLKNYMDKNRGELDETAMDYYDVTLNGLKDQKALNIDFLSYQERLPGEQAKMDEYLLELDKDQVWTAENIGDLKKMQAPLTNFLGEFRAKHGDRLQSKAYQDYNLQLNNMQSNNSFLLQSALDDGFLREDEAKAYMINMQSGNTDASDRLNKLEDVKISSQIKTITAKLGEKMAEVDMFKKFKAGDTSIPTDGMGNYDPNGEVPLTWAELSLDSKGNKLPQNKIEEKQGLWDARIKNKIDSTRLLDRQYQEITTSGSYVDPIDPNLLTPIPVKKKKKDTKEQVDSQEKSISELKTDLKTSTSDLKTKRKKLNQLSQAEKAGYTVNEEELEKLKQEVPEAESTVSSLRADIKSGGRYGKIKNYAKKILISRGLTTKENIDEYIKNNPKDWDRAQHEARKNLEPSEPSIVGGVPMGSTRPRD